MYQRLIHRVRDVAVGDETSWHDGVLTVSADQARSILAAPCLADAKVTWASPGASVRIVKVLDAIEPRTKGPGGGGIFPGWLGDNGGGDGGKDGDGATPVHILRGAAVVIAGYLPRAQEAVIDMSGPAAELSPFGATHNLVIEFTPAPDADWADVDDALRRGSLALAAALAEAALDAEPDEVEEAAGLADAIDGLPRVGAITNLQTQGTFKDVFVNATSFMEGEPTLVDPADIDAGLVVSGQFGHPALRNPTFVHLNHPVARALQARHGRDLSFAGILLTPEPVQAKAKEAMATRAAQAAKEAGFEAVIVTKEGGGNADADMSLKMDALEELGIATVGLFAEMAGPDGTGPPIVVPPEKATAMISVGNYDQRYELPEMERALGGDELALLGVPATDAMELPAAVILAALSPLGWGRTTCSLAPQQPELEEGA